MSAKSYSKGFKIQVAEDALKPENERAVEILAVKYGIQPRTVVKWRNMYKENGPQAFNRGYITEKDKRTAKLLKENEELKEEIEILKKAAAFLADVMRR